MLGIKLTYFKQGDFSNTEALSDVVFKLGSLRLEAGLFPGGISLGVQNAKHSYSLDFIRNRPDLIKKDEYTIFCLTT